MDNIFFDLKGCSLWARAEDYVWEDDCISPVGKFERYNPFDDVMSLYHDFYTLIQRITDYRNAFFLTAGIEEGVEKPNPKVILSREERRFKTEYLNFAKNWGLLGVGFSRIIESTITEVENDGSTSFSDRVRRLYLREASPWASYSEKYTIWKDICPDDLPYCGEITIADWKKSYYGMSWQTYKESLYSVVACYDILDVREDIYNQSSLPALQDADNGSKPFLFYSMGMRATSSGISWKFNSLMQAITIIHALNKSEQLEKKWGICPVCKKMFALNDPRRRYCDNQRCRETMKKRRQRERKKGGEKNAKT